MIRPRLVQFDAKGRETARGLTQDEIVEIHYDHNPEAGSAVFEVELTPRAPRANGCPLVRVNLNDGVSLLFDAPDDVEYLLTEIRDAVNVAVEQRKVRT